MALTEQEKRDIARMIVEEQKAAAPRAAVPDDFISFRDLRTVTTDEIDGSLHMPIENDKETAIILLSQLQQFLAPRASGDTYGLVRITNALDLKSGDTALSALGASNLKEAIDDANSKKYDKTGGNITGDCSANNFFSRDKVTAPTISASSGMTSPYIRSDGDLEARGNIKSRSDIIAFTSTSAPIHNEHGEIVGYKEVPPQTLSEMMPKARKVLQMKPKDFNELGWADIAELLADAIDQTHTKLRKSGVKI